MPGPPSPALAAVLLVGGGLVIAFAGPRLAATASALSRRHGLGQAVAGSILLGAVTSLSGLVVSVDTAASGAPAVAVANALGGIAAQTAFLAVADFAHRGVNLEHAAIDPGNLFVSSLLVAMLALVAVAMAGPAVSFFPGIHPVSVLLVVTYFGGLRLAAQTDEDRTWVAARSRYPTERVDTDDDPRGPASSADQASTTHLWTVFVVAAAVTGGSGWLIGRSAIQLSEEVGIAQGVAGGVLTAVATSSAELVTCIAAVRRGHLALAVGDILGGNVFDVLFLSVADAAYPEASIYHAAGPQAPFLAGIGILLAAVVMMGLVRREPEGPAAVGFESVSVIAIYVVAVVVLMTS